MHTSFDRIKAAELPNSLNTLATTFLMAIFIAVLWFSTIVYTAPKDIFSTAYWYDSLGIQQVYTTPLTNNETPLLVRTILETFNLDVAFSSEALVFAIVIWVLQPVTIFISLLQGRWWVKGKKYNYFTTAFVLLRNFFYKKRPFRWGEVNKSRFTYMSAYFTLMLFDTWTDVGFMLETVPSPTFEQVAYVILISILVYNIISEWGCVELPGFFLQIVLILGKAVQADMKGVLPKRRKSQNKQNKQNRSQNRQHQNNRSQNRGGARNQQRNRQQTRPQTVNPDELARIAAMIDDAD